LVSLITNLFGLTLRAAASMLSTCSKAVLFFQSLDSSGERWLLDTQSAFFLGAVERVVI
jgi:hypothetical protein